MCCRLCQERGEETRIHTSESEEKGSGASASGRHHKKCLKIEMEMNGSRVLSMGSHDGSTLHIIRTLKVSLWC